MKIYDEFKIIVDGKKKCKICKSIKTLNDFNFILQKYRLECKICLRKITRELPSRKVYLRKNKFKIAEAVRNHYVKNRNKILEYNRKILYPKNRKNPRYIAKKLVSCRLRIALNRFKLKKISTVVKYLGCSAEFFFGYIESLFLPGMTWKNQGVNGWEIDHRIPCEGYDLSVQEEIYKCFYFRNLQPLWKADNAIKNDIMPDGSRARDIPKIFKSERGIREIEESFSGFE